MATPPLPPVRAAALGRDAVGNRVGALAIAEKAGVTAEMLRLAPKLEDVACLWLAIINSARSALNHLPGVVSVARTFYRDGLTGSASLDYEFYGQ